jgi:hypothetical protein
MIRMKLYVLCYVLFTDIGSYKKNKSGFGVVDSNRKMLSKREMSINGTTKKEEKKKERV